VFVPPRCPRLECPAHLQPRGGWYRATGFYVVKCRTDPVPRFRCELCRKGFSRQTFRHDYYDKKPWSNAPLLMVLTSGVGLRQAGRCLQLDVHSVQRKLRKFARTCQGMHANLSPRLPANRTFLLDEEETFEKSSIQPVTMPVLIELETWFVVAVGAAPIRRLAEQGTRRRAWQDKQERRHGKRPDGSRSCVRETLLQLAAKLAGAKLTLRSDEKSSYRTLLQEVFGEHVQHETTPGSASRTAYNPLFPINTTLAMTRDNNGRLRRRSWLVSKRREDLKAQMYLFVAYRNYVRRRFNRDQPDQTPACLLQLVPRAMLFPEVLSWRQDWGDASIHPMSERADRTVRDVIKHVA
jgi:transposase-like protein